MFLRSWRAHQALPWAHQPSFHPSTYVRVCVHVCGRVGAERGCEGSECSRVSCRPQETVAVAKEGGLASFFFVLLQQVCRARVRQRVGCASHGWWLYTCVQANAIARANVRALGGNALIG